MIYFDTNVLIYSTTDQDQEKALISKKIIEKSIKSDIFVVSPLVLNEFIFVLSKQKIIDKYKQNVEFYARFCRFWFDKSDVLCAYNKCHKLNKCRNINDFIHLEIANKHCKKLVTFDSDFKNLQKFYDVEIDILGV